MPNYFYVFPFSQCLSIWGCFSSFSNIKRSRETLFPVFCQQSFVKITSLFSDDGELTQSRTDFRLKHQILVLVLVICRFPTQMPTWSSSYVHYKSEQSRPERVSSAHWWWNSFVFSQIDYKSSQFHKIHKPYFLYQKSFFIFCFFIFSLLLTHAVNVKIEDNKAPRSWSYLRALILSKVIDSANHSFIPWGVFFFFFPSVDLY